MKMKRFLVLGVLFMISAVSYAQPAFDPDVDDVAPLPGIALAVAAGVAIGVRKALKNK